jgi:N-acetylglutamate synthase-like GNAT family acetyltransferase
MIIRHALPEDAPKLVPLLAQMGDVYQRTSDELYNRIMAFNRERQQLLVAEEIGKIIGVIAFGCYEQFRLQGCCCHIDTLVIDDTYRGKGVGKALLLKAEAYANEQGATEIELTTANFRRKTGTHDFYKAQGYDDHIEIDCSYFVKKGQGC